MKGNMIKVVTLVLLIVLVIVTFKLTDKNRNNNNLQQEDLPQSQPVSSPSNKVVNKNEEVNKPEIKENNDPVVVEEENNIIKQYKLYNSYIITKETNKYQEVGYKYFIIRSYNEFKQYIDDYIISYDGSTKYNSYNEETKQKMLEYVGEDFFNTNALIFVVDINQKKAINGTITEISMDDNKEVSIKIKKILEDNLSNMVTFMIPVEKGVKSAKVTHIN